ncbi:FAD-binding oxidoreductase [Bradyrhizobium hipponense]|uniref:FAD-binding oxidoreductase n=1 Tax=Bradyrhizobium hipponense TaxID=2605638 RepID=A0A5S4Y9F3_9BRAD|nr:FAD-binding oxidoreductase [Bradyrhizobium hipponense]TYO61060.1 FAD-binding oxidoreductase [Bradyrhizobium hipponense]
MLVAVLGAGIMGASLAIHLARNDVTVLLFDDVGAGSGATRPSFDCLDFFTGATSDDMRFRSEALHYQAELSGQIGLADAVRRTGTLRWSTKVRQNRKLIQAARMAEALGRTVEYLSRNDALILEPNLSIVGCPEVIVRVPQEGWLDSVHFTKRLIDIAVDTRLTHCIFEKCKRMEPLNHGVELWTDRTSYFVDAVVLAGSGGINLLLEEFACAPLANEMLEVLTLLRYIGPPIKHVVFANHTHFRANEHSLVIRNAFDRASIRDPGVAIRAAGESVSSVRRELKRARFEDFFSVQIGSRPVSEDGYPIVGRLPGLPRMFVATTQADITLAPYIALLLSTEIAEDASCEALDPFRPDRFI